MMKKPRLAHLVNSLKAATSKPASILSMLRFLRFNNFSSPSPSPDKLEEYRRKVADTNIDPRSFLSTDYFNMFNSVVMVLDMLPDAPELLEEIEHWQFLGYVEHFKISGLGFADLAIEGYPLAPPELRETFERKVNSIRVIIEELARTLRRLLDAGENETFSITARLAATQLRAMMQEGNSIVHGSSAIAQTDIDKMF
jgi:hypothetical protein